MRTITEIYKHDIGTVEDTMKAAIDKLQSHCPELFADNAEMQFALRHDGRKGSFRIHIKHYSTQGFRVIVDKPRERFVVETLEYSSRADIMLAYCMIEAAKNEGALLVDGADGSIVDRDIDWANAVWQSNNQTMADVIAKGEPVNVETINFDFTIVPSYYSASNADEAVANAWADLSFADTVGNLVRHSPLEVRQVGEGTKSTVRTISINDGHILVRPCDYVGMMLGNKCKYVKMNDLYDVMRDTDIFRPMGPQQFFLRDMTDEAQWAELWNKAIGVVEDNYRKTVVLRWNPDISSMKLDRFMETYFDAEEPADNWSVFDHENIHQGDHFVMMRVGNGRQCITMEGEITSEPYLSTDWRGTDRPVYYVNILAHSVMHPDDAPYVMSAEGLQSRIPTVDWAHGHSGEVLTADEAQALDQAIDGYFRYLTTEAEDEVRAAELRKTTRVDRIEALAWNMDDFDEFDDEEDGDDFDDDDFDDDDFDDDDFDED